MLAPSPRPLILQQTRLRRRSAKAVTLIAAACCLFSAALPVRAQDLEPRAYSNTPVGMNFLLAGYRYSDGALVFDPALPVTDANARVDMGFVAYVRAMGIAGKSAKAGMVLPYARLDASGFVDDVLRTREQDGLADPAFYFTVNLSGAPALSFEEFRDYRQETIVGLTFRLTAPLGAYDDDRLLNIGTNRWSFKPEIGISRAWADWTFEAAAAAIVFSDNDDFDSGKTRKQEPIYSLQGHVIYAFPGGIWAALGATYYAGGRTTIDGVMRDDRVQGATLS